MAFDGVTISCMVQELHQLLQNGRVDKINQPEYDELWLQIRAGGKNHRLVLSASASNPRLHLTAQQKENPEKAPMFCMLLRKHLSGGKVVGVFQPGFERIAELHIESRDELGDVSVKRLIIEIMGRHSNIILCDGGGRVLGSIRYVDFSVSGVRQLLPGMQYEMPPSQHKLDPAGVTAAAFLEQLRGQHAAADAFLLDTFTGIGPLTAREIAYRALGAPDIHVPLLTQSQQEKFAEFFAAYFEKIKQNRYEPMLLYKEDGKIWDFSGVGILQYEESVRTEAVSSLNEAVDRYYAVKDFQARMSQKSASLLKFLDQNIQRCQKKLALQQQKMKDCEKKEQNKILGDLLTANLYRISEGDTAVTVENYYSGMEPLQIKLKPELTPAQNAQRYYTLYQKLKTAEVVTAQQMRLAEEELDYLESVKESLALAESERDINKLRDELYSQGYRVKRAERSKARKPQASAPLAYQLSDGFTAYVGRNNTQNDELTLRRSRPNDLWFHTKHIHGSHTVLRTEGRTPPDGVIVEAAKLCAYYSKARNSANVPVDYTIIKNVKKPSGAKPGMVIYDHYSTVYVTPALPEQT